MNTRMIHQIENQFDELQNYNLYRTDPVLQEILMRYGSQDQALLVELGEKVGTNQAYLWADQANRHTPELHTFDARGRRIDNLEFHPAWHAWMKLNRQYGVHAHPFIAAQSKTNWVDWAARFYLSGQVECGNLCPNAMTLGNIPLLQREPKLWQQLGEK